MIRVPSRGLALIEACFALTILTIVIVAACMVMGMSNRHAAAQWEDLTANEFADSMLEHVLAQKTCAPTSEKGRAIGSEPNDPALPPGVDATLFVTKNAKDDALVDVRVTVSWRRELAQNLDADARIESTFRRRAQR